MTDAEQALNLLIKLNDRSSDTYCLVPNTVYESTVAGTTVWEVRTLIQKQLDPVSRSASLLCAVRSAFAQTLCGLSVDHAKDLCVEQGLEIRITYVGSKPCICTRDFNTSRINVRVSDSKDSKVILEFMGIG